MIKRFRFDHARTLVADEELDHRPRQLDLRPGDPNERKVTVKYEPEVLLAACRLTPGRFRGRAQLTEAAVRGDCVALERLCLALGIRLPEANWGKATQWRQDHPAVRLTREEWELAHAYGAGRLPLYPHNERARVLWNAVRQLRASRANAKPPPPPVPCRILAMHYTRLMKALTKTAKFRTATHGHACTVSVVEPGAEDVTCSTSAVSPSTVNLPAAYGYPALVSKHHWQLSRLPTVKDGALYLSPTRRVVQGRGTRLNVERLTEVKGRFTWKLWRH